MNYYEVKIVAKFEATIKVEAANIWEACSVAEEAFVPVVSGSGIDNTIDKVLDYATNTHPTSKDVVKVEEVCS